MATIETSATSLTQLRSAGGFCKLPQFGLAEVTGADAARFLQAQTTNDVSKLTAGKGQKTCLLDRKAHVKALFDLFKVENGFLIVAELEQIKKILEHLDQYRFADKVEFGDITSSALIFCLQGPRSLKILSDGSEGGLNASDVERDVWTKNLFGCEARIFRLSLTGEDGYLIYVLEKNCGKFEERISKACQSSGMMELSPAQLDNARIEAGIVLYGVDVTEDNLMPETGLDESAVSYTKGCFLGQEVLARVKSHGAPSRGLAGLVFEAQVGETFPIDTPISVEGETIGWIKSNCYSPQLKHHIAMAYVKREFRTPDRALDAEINGKRYGLKVVLLPFYAAAPARQRARKIYEQALLLFANEAAEDEDPQSVKLLEEALMLDPQLEDAYEVLGVILSKRDRLDEAIALMHKLADLNPDSVMAHANLSVFYLEKGDKEKAEEEKAVSMSIRMRLAAREATRAMKEEQERKQKKEEAKERMEMFSQVLEIDSEDLLANYGMGDCLVVLEEYEKAIPYLNKALAVKPMHTVAYVALARALNGLGRTKEAVDALNRGIEVASRKGDMTPLKEMQQQLAMLSGKAV